MVFSDLKVGHRYSFNTTAPGILGQSISRAKLLSIGNVDVARQFSPIDMTYRQIYPLLPPGSPKDPSLLTFYLFEAENKSKIVFASNWIIETTLSLVESITAKVVIKDATLEQLEPLREALVALGFTSFDITVTS